MADSMVHAEHFAARYRGCGLVGMLALLLVVGRWFHAEAFKHRRFSALGAGIPPSLLGGLTGLLFLVALKEVASMDRLVDKARDQLHEMVTDLIPHAFAALTLGFAAGSSLGGHRVGGSGSASDLFASWHQLGAVLYHEGIPMLLYDQVLGWGNSVVALAVNVLWRWLDLSVTGLTSGQESVSPYAGAVITLGLEAGREVLPVQLRGDTHAEATVHLADNTGLLLSLGLGSLLLTALLARPPAAAPAASSAASGERGGLGAGSSHGPLVGARGASEGLDPSSSPERVSMVDDEQKDAEAQAIPALLRRALFGQQEAAYHRGGGPSDFTSGGLTFRATAQAGSSSIGHGGVSGGSGLVAPGSEAFAPPGGRPLGGGAAEPSSPAALAPPFPAQYPTSSQAPSSSSSSSPRAGESSTTEFSGLGAHVAMVALSVFVAYGWLLGLKVLESTWALLGRHSVLSSVRLFKMSMLAALMMLRTVRPRLRTPMQPEWFYRVSGICLDLLVLGSVSSLEWAEPIRALREGGGRGASLLGSFELTILAITGWNLYAVRFLAPDFFPNFPFARATVLVGDNLGHSWVGMLLARGYDPLLATPVPLAFVAKMLLSIPVPGSAVKNQLVLSSIETMGLVPTLIGCAAVLGFWLRLHAVYFRPLWPQRHLQRHLARGGGDAAAAAMAPSGQRGTFDLFEGDASGDGANAQLSLLPAKDAAAPKAPRKAGGDVEGHPSGDKAAPPLLPLTPSDGAPSSGQSGGIAVGLGDGERLPVLSEDSGILDTRQVAAISRALPSAAQREKAWRLVYSLTRDGSSSQTLIASCAKHATYLLVVEDSWGYVFGASFTHSLTEQRGPCYYGTGEGWLFSFHNRAPEQLSAYRWCGANELLVMSGPPGFGIAFGGGGGFGLHLDDMLDNGVSNSCATFANKRLSSSEFFKTLNVEVWCLEAMPDHAKASGHGRSIAATAAAAPPALRSRGYAGGPHPRASYGSGGGHSSGPFDHDGDV